MSTKKMQIIGLKGKSAYQYAQDGGYTGTEAEFKNKMAKELDAVYDYNNLNEAILATAIKQEASGEFIHITDSAALPIMDFGTEGKTEQKTIAGNQLFDISRALDENEYEIIDTTTYGGTSAEQLVLRFQLESNDNYVFSATKNNVTLNLRLFYGNKYTSMINPDCISFTTGDDGLLYIGFHASGGVSAQIDGFSCGQYTNIMLNKGSTALPYEPYTGAQPSPNPDYPQEIINAGTYNETTGRYEIGCRVVNKNLFDKNNVNVLECYISDKIIPAKGYKTLWIPCIPNTDYTISKGIISKKFKLAFFNSLEDGSITDSQASNDIGTSVTCNSKDNKYLCIWYYTVNETVAENDILNSLQIEINVIPTEFTDYNSTEFTLTSPVALTKWDNLVKRDGVYGWSIQAKEYNLSADEVTLQANSGSSEKIRIYIHNAVAKEYSECRCSIIRYASGSPNIGYGNYFFADKFGAIIPNSWLEPYGYVYNTEADDSSVNYPNAIAAFKAMLKDKGNIQILVDMQEEQAFHPLPDSEQALLKSLETYYQVTNIFNDQNCPMSIQYIADTQTYVDNLATSLTNAVVSLGGEV